MMRRLTVLLASAGVTSTLSKAVLKGICYGPAPLKGKGTLPEDDFMDESSKAMWSSSGQGRGDLAIMKALGANAVRLYGNDPRVNHKAFLDEAKQNDLEVIPGISDYPYTQMDKNCMSSEFNCYSQIKAQYSEMLKGGFLQSDGSYHPQLRHIIVINEPDLKIPSINEPTKYCRAIISAIDAMLDAEKEAGASGVKPNFTATFSFGVCNACTGSSKPSLGQMYELRKAMEKPEDYGYTPKNDLANIFRTRFTNSFNTNNPASDMRPMFLNAYEEAFPATPVFIAEYHAPRFPTSKDMKAIMDISESSPLLVGVSFFEYQIRYDKGGSEMEFGMFGLGDVSLGSMNLFGEVYRVWCLSPVNDPMSGNTPVHQAVTAAFGGTGVSENQLCFTDPSKEPITEEGYNAVLLLQKTPQMAIFVKRVVEHMGGSVSNGDELDKFAAKYSGEGGQPVKDGWSAMVSELGGHPGWAAWDGGAACVADRSSDTPTLDEAIGYACGKLLPSFNCSSSEDLPSFCAGDPWQKADYVFSAFFLQLGSDQPLRDCYYSGAMVFAPSGVFTQQDSTCVITKDPRTTALTEGGYREVLKLKKPAEVEIFVQREITSLHMQVTDSSGLSKLAANPPPTFKALQDALHDAPWLCGGAARACSDNNGPGGSNVGWWIAGAGAIAVLLAGAVAVAVLIRKRNQQPQARVPLVGDSA